MVSRALTLTIGVGLLVLAPPDLVVAGDLDPPNGSVKPTLKTLDEVEPRIPLTNQFDTLKPVVITSPGSYYLAEDIFALPDQHGIEITASHVSLDLRGFAVIGNIEVGSIDGIHLTGNLEGVEIKNGTVRQFFQDGVDAQLSKGCRFENLCVHNNILTGLRSGASGAVVRCTAVENSLDGISLGTGSSAVGCTAIQNGSRGIAAGSGSLVRDSVARESGASGIDFVSTGTAIGCVSTNNEGDGFSARLLLHRDRLQCSRQCGARVQAVRRLERERLLGAGEPGLGVRG